MVARTGDAGQSWDVWKGGDTMNWKRWIWIGVLAVWLSFTVTAPEAWAQEYRFTLDRNISRVIVNRDGSADIEYWLTFTCAPGAHPIDIVDVGMPNRTYDLNSAQAWFSAGSGGGQEVPLDDILKSEVVSVGIEVHLGPHTIQPGSQGTLHVRVNVREMVYPDSQDENYASVEFAPTFYDNKYVQGQTYMEIGFYFPVGVSSEETRYHETEFHEVDSIDDRIVFIYKYPEIRGSETRQHGISFPRSYVDQVYKAPVTVGGSGSGGSAIAGLFSNLPACGCFGAVGLFIVGSVVLSTTQAKKRKMAYLPPALSVEGVGIKRGLTAVEAAILLELPLNRALTMILFGILKKKGVVVLEDDPLRLEPVVPKPEANWRAYENGFLESILKNGRLSEEELQKCVVELVKSVNGKLKGFSRKETVAYYQDIVKRAWDQVAAETTPEIKSKYFDQGLEWMMMDEKFEERTTQTFGSGPVFMPPWWAYYRPWRPGVQSSRVGGGRATSTSSSGGGVGRQVTLPTLPGAAFASTVVTGMERTAGGIVGRLENFTGGVTNRTNPIPKSTSSRSSSFKSGGCACACACACAGCACACAGGGR
ncbi:MAG: hypothetical protein ISS56_10105 [Anaerolineae bacterium]|nr:hypothetical protein [Anaerolineae bacterium]